MTPFDAAVDYHVQCEKYDRTICTAMGKDGALPANNRERMLVEKNALMQLSTSRNKISGGALPMSDFKRLVSARPVITEAQRILAKEEAV